MLFCHCLYFISFYQICLSAWHGTEVFLWLGNSLWEQNGWGLQGWGLLSILETNRIANARFTDKIEFNLPKNNAFLSQNSRTNLNCETVCIWYVICAIGLCAWCRMVRPVSPPAQLWRFCKLTEWMFLRGHPVLLTLTPSSTFRMWSVGRSREGVLEMSGNYSNLS